MFAICSSPPFSMRLGKLWKRQWKVKGKSREKFINATICQKLNGKRFAAKCSRKSYEHRLLITEKNLLHGIPCRCGGAENSAQCLGIKSFEAFAVGSTRTKLFIFHGNMCEWRVGWMEGKGGTLFKINSSQGSFWHWLHICWPARKTPLSHIIDTATTDPGNETILKHIPRKLERWC